MSKKKTGMLIFLMLAILPAGPSILAGTSEKSLKYGIKSETILTPLPRIIKWIDDHHFLQYRSATEDQKPVFETVDLKSGSIQPYHRYNRLKNLPEEFTLTPGTEISRDGNHCLFVRDGDIYHYSLESHIFCQLTDTKEPEKNPVFSPDSEFIAYTRDGNLYIFNLGEKTEHPLTQDGAERVYNGKAAWVYYEEILGRRSRYQAFWWAPDSRRIAFLRFDETAVPTYTLVRGTGTHGELEVTPYPKPGDPNPRVKLGIADVDSREVTWLHDNSKTDDYIAWPFWTPDGTTLLYQTLNRDQDHLVLHSADPLTAESRRIYEETQSAWVDFFTHIHFLEKRGKFISRSDKTGWSHLYLHSLTGNRPTAITGGEWDVRELHHIDQETGTLYFSGFMKNSTQNHLFRVQLDGTGLTRITDLPGYHRINLSPDAGFCVDTFASIDTPAIRYVRDLKRNSSQVLLDPRKPAFFEYRLGKTELFHIPADDGTPLPARWILPPDMDPQKKYPVLFKIYGGPQAPSVRNTFPSLSHFYLASQGIIVISVDHRGTGHFGKQGAALMHRRLGHWEIKDYTDAVKWLRTRKFVDPRRIGISGGSYGGYLTCLALTRGSDYFTHGFASAPVTDWRLYDSIYTERYMDTPSANPEGYQAGSVLTFADRLQGPLFLIHGEMDDNVHPINSIQLISELQDLDKDFRFMLYPDGRHGWGGAKRIHSRRMETQFWFTHLLNRSLDPRKD